MLDPITHHLRVPTETKLTCFPSIAILNPTLLSSHLLACGFGWGGGGGGGVGGGSGDRQKPPRGGENCEIMKSNCSSSSSCF